MNYGYGNIEEMYALRIKSDKEHASTLQNLCNLTDKVSTSQINYVRNVSMFWLMIQWIEQFGRIMKTHTEGLNSGPLHKLSHDNQRQAAGEKKLYRFHQ